MLCEVYLNKQNTIKKKEREIQFIYLPHCHNGCYETVSNDLKMIFQCRLNFEKIYSCNSLICQTPICHMYYHKF